jgi:hypothetical protein
MTTSPKKRTRHGLNSLLARINLRGLDAIDRRTAAARSLLQWRERLIADLGGAQAISSQRLVLVDVATRTKALLDHADEFLLAQRSIINRRNRSLIPLVRERQALADSLSRLLGQLGLDRQEKPAKSLAEYLHEKDREKEVTP